MAILDITDPQQVKNQLQIYAENFPTFCDAINNINNCMGTINKSWKGDRYKLVMKAWNDKVPGLKNSITVLFSGSEVLNAILYNYTSADTKAISLNPPKKASITDYTVDPSPSIYIAYEKVKSAIDTIKKNSTVGHNAAVAMKNANLSAKWSDSGEDIDKSKKKIDTALEKIIDYFDKITGDAGLALQFAHSDFHKAGHQSQ